MWTPCVGPKEGGGGGGGQFKPILGLKNGVFDNFYKNSSIYLGLGLVSSDSPKDVESGQNLVFGKILSFPRANWAQKWTKTENFGYALFVLKHLIWKRCSHTVFF